MLKRTSLIWVAFTLTILLLLCFSGQEKKVIKITANSKAALDFYHQAIDAMNQAYEKEAVENFKKAIESDPTFVMARAYYSLFLNAPENQRMLDEAKKYFENVTEGEKLFTLAMEAGIKNDVGKQREILEELTRKYPDDAMAHYQLGIAYGEAKKFQKAVEELKKAISCDSSFFAAYNSLGYGCIRLGNFDEAIKYFKAYAELMPQSANPIDSLGDAYRLAGKYKEAWKCYQKAAEIKPEFTPSHMHLGDVKAELGYYEEAIPYYQNGLRTLLPEKEISESHYRLADSYYRLRLANTFLQMGKLSEAEKEINAILLNNWDPTNVVAHYLRAEVALKNGDVSRARKEAELVEMLEKNYNLFSQEKGQIGNFIKSKVAFSDGDLISAEKFAMAAVNAYGQKGQANLLSWAYSLGNSRQICIEPLNFLSEVKRKQNKTAEEIEIIRKSLQLIPHQPKLHFRLGEIFADQKRKDEARREFSEFLTLAKEFKVSKNDMAKAKNFKIP